MTRAADPTCRGSALTPVVCVKLVAWQAQMFGAQLWPATLPKRRRLPFITLSVRHFGSPRRRDLAVHHSRSSITYPRVLIHLLVTVLCPPSY